MLIKQYKIKFIDRLSNEAQATIVASDKLDAMIKLGVAEHNFIASSVDYKLNTALSIPIQLQILTRIGAGIASGESHVQYLPSILNDFKKLKNKRNFIEQEIEKGLELSQLLLLIDINHIAINLIANGERSGKLGNSVTDAKAFLRIELKTQKSTSKTLKGSALYLLAAVVLIFGAPIFVVDFYAQVESSGLRIKHNYATDLLFLLNDINFTLGVILTIVVAFITIKSKLFLSLFGRFYPVSIFKNIVESKKSILFLSIFSPLHKSGLPTEQIIESYKSIDAINSKKLKKSMLEGVSVSEAVQSLPFSKTFKAGFKGFNRINNKKHKTIMLDELYLSLVEDIEAHNKSASILIKIFADAAIYSIVFVLLYGFMLPQLSMGVAL